MTKNIPKVLTGDLFTSHANSQNDCWTCIIPLDVSPCIVWYHFPEKKHLTTWLVSHVTWAKLKLAVVIWWAILDSIQAGDSYSTKTWVYRLRSHCHDYDHDLKNLRESEQIVNTCILVAASAWSWRILGCPDMPGRFSTVLCMFKTYRGGQSLCNQLAGLSSAVGSEFDCKSRGRWFKPRSRYILSLRFGHEKKFYDHSHLSADSRRAVVSYWQKNGH